jgi:hypothetical protein
MIFCGCRRCDADILVAVRAPVFSRPGPISRSRSSTCTFSSGADTPPLSVEDGSSLSDGSQSSIDLSHVNVMLSNTSHPVPTTAQDRARARARGHGHRRRISEARASRTSIYETIEEEMTSSSNLPTSPHSSLDDKTSVNDLTHGRSSVFVVDPDSAYPDSRSTWDDENGITELRRYYALREEAEDTLTDSKRVWLDTPFSLYAIQCKHILQFYFCSLFILTFSFQPSFLPSIPRACRLYSSTLWRLTVLFLLNSVAFDLERSLDHPLIHRPAPLNRLSLPSKPVHR